MQLSLHTTTGRLSVTTTGVGLSTILHAQRRKLRLGLRWRQLCRSPHTLLLVALIIKAQALDDALLVYDSGLRARSLGGSGGLAGLGAGITLRAQRSDPGNGIGTTLLRHAQGEGD